MTYAYKKISVDGVKIDEHRYIMEAYLNRKLNFNEVIHHKDGNKQNNDISNLEVMSRSEHNKLHNIGKQLSEEHRKKLSDALTGRCNLNNRALSEREVIELLNMHKRGLSSRKIAEFLELTRAQFY